MNANALQLAPINTVITTANMVTPAEGDCRWNSVFRANWRKDSSHAPIKKSKKDKLNKIIENKVYMMKYRAYCKCKCSWHE